MIGSTRSVRVFAYTVATDMRKGMDGLYGLVTGLLEKDPLSGDLFLFVSRDRKRAKVLLWDGTGLCLAHCWAHVRRKFLEGEDAYPELSKQALDRIGALFEIERGLPRSGPAVSDGERAGILELRRQIRQENSKRIVNDLLTWALEHRGAVLPRSKMGKAITYMLELWEGLTRFLDNPRIPLDNNAAERALRGVVVGRKNHYGSRSKRGTEVAAIFYTLFETAKLSQVDPRAYLTQAARRAIAPPGAVTLPSDLA